MKKHIVFVFVFFAMLFLSHAGDSAVLVDKGFSKDGNYYIFGQYGKTDVKFQGWAELYTVNVITNDYVDGGVFKVKPSKFTFEKTGKEVFNNLEAKSFYFTKQIETEPARPDNILYLRDVESKSGTDEIVFKDFISSISSDQAVYSVKLLPEYTGVGENVRSSFYINLEKRDAEGRVLAAQKIGSPFIKRKGVSAYKIEKIVCTKDGRNIVFIIEKTFEDKTGINIRYMVEAAVLSEDFFTRLAETGREDAYIINSEENSRGVISEFVNDDLYQAK